MGTCRPCTLEGAPAACRTPRFVLSKKKVLGQFQKVSRLADVVSYSSKTNQDVTRILEDSTDCWFSMHLINELKHVEDMSRILFLAHAWDDRLIDRLFKLGITKFAVDNVPDLELLLAFLDGNDIKIDLFLRIRLHELTVRTERYFVFGMSADTINELIPKLRENPNIGRLGVHFHRKTQNMSEWDLEHDISGMLDDKTLEMVDFVNIGGGLPSVYASTNKDVLKSIFEKISSFKDWLAERDVNMVIEPGRFIAAPAVELHTRIIRVYDNNIVVDASVYNTDMDAIIVPVKLLVEGELDKGKGKAYVIKGLTPCSMDIFRYRVYLNDPEVGDKIIFLNAGAYNFSSDFCDLEKLETEIVD
ncbi:MAG: decarboxylase [Nanoarchaeota archaeon]|nr:decarboxylase [Nanoarchaeota archaeon]